MYYVNLAITCPNYFCLHCVLMLCCTKTSHMQSCAYKQINVTCVLMCLRKTLEKMMSCNGTIKTTNLSLHCIAYKQEHIAFYGRLT